MSNLKEGEAGGVMGPIAHSDSLPAEVSYNYHPRCRKAADDSTKITEEIVAVNNPIRTIEEAAIAGNQATAERVFYQLKYNWVED